MYFQKGRMGKKHRLLIIALLLSAVVASGCAEQKDITLAKKDTGKSVKLVKDQKMTITLESNPTTAYSWEIKAIDKKVIEQIGEAEFTQEMQGSNLIGAPEFENFRFEAAGKGETELKMVYRRPWEKDIKPIVTFSVKVRVK